MRRSGICKPEGQLIAASFQLIEKKLFSNKLLNSSNPFLETTSYNIPMKDRKPAEADSLLAGHMQVFNSPGYSSME